MRKFKKKFMAAALSLSMLVSVFAPSAFADEVSNNTATPVQSEESVQSERIVNDSSSKQNNASDEGMYAKDSLDSGYSKAGSNFKSIYGNERYETSVKVSQEGWKDGADTVVIVNGKDTIMGIIATPLATTYNAPILLAKENYIHDSVLKELKRLNPKTIYLIGDRSHLSKQVSDKIKADTGANMIRIFGQYPGEVSANVAENIVKAKKVDTAYIVSATNGVADALSISAKAGTMKNPVIVVDKNYINTNAMNFLKKYADTVYYVGGENSISSKLIGQIGSAVKNGGKNNRIYGSDRHGTNVSVINRFYKNSEFPAAVITKSENAGLIDTVSAGPLAAKFEAPIIITGRNSIPSVTMGLLSERKADSIYQIGGGISSTVSNTIKTKLKDAVKPAPQPVKPQPQPVKPQPQKPSVQQPVKPQPQKPAPQPESNPGVINSIKGKKIVIDPGHGGHDTGAVGINGVREKDWTLKTALSSADYLTKAGANVILTRTNDTYPTLPDRTNLSNSQNADFFCSIHYNKGGDVINPATQELSGTGVEVYTGDGAKAKSTGKKVLDSILSVFNLRNRGVKDGTHLFVIRNTNAPAILVEGGFVSNRKDVGLLNNDNALKKMGIQIAKGIIAAFSNR